MVARSREIPPSLKGELKVAGLESCRALFATRARDIARVYVIDRIQSEVHDILAWCDRHDIEWYEVTLDELAQFTETMHHDGICMVARRKPLAQPAVVSSYLSQNAGPTALVLLDGVKNPNNVGAVARTCAYFGVRYLLAAGESAGFSQAAVRVAQGATEAVDLVQLQSAAALSFIMSKDIVLVTTTSHGTARLDTTPLPGRAIFCFGGENSGVSPEIAKLAKTHITIPGVGGVESLNLAQAAAILLWEHWRTHRAGEARPAPRPTSSKRRR